MASDALQDLTSFAFWPHLLITSPSRWLFTLAFAAPRIPQACSCFRAFPAVNASHSISLPPSYLYSNAIFSVKASLLSWHTPNFTHWLTYFIDWFLPFTKKSALWSQRLLPILLTAVSSKYNCAWPNRLDGRIDGMNLKVFIQWTSMQHLKLAIPFLWKQSFSKVLNSLLFSLTALPRPTLKVLCLLEYWCFQGFSLQAVFFLHMLLLGSFIHCPKFR